MRFLIKRVLSITFSVLIFSCSQSPQKNVQPKSPIQIAHNTPFIQGAYFNGTNGIYFDQEDRLHIASVVGRKITIVDTQTGAIIEEIGSEKGIEGPDDLTFGPDGSMYFTSILTGEVGRRMPNGEVIKQFVAPGVNPITFSDAGRLFVALDFQGDGLYELDPDLIEPPKLLIKQLGWLNAMDFGPDGYLYGPIWSKGQIVKIDVDKLTVDVIADDMKTPAAVKFNSKGDLFTIDNNTGNLYKIDHSIGIKKVIGSGYHGGDNLAFNSNDELYMTNAQDGSILQIMKDGSNRVVIAPGLNNANDIEIVKGQLFAADVLSLRSFDYNTGQQISINRHIIGSKGIISPFTIDHEGDVLALTSWFANEVQLWNLKGNHQEAIYHDYAVPINAILHGGTLIVSELGTSSGAAKITIQKDGVREVIMDASKGLIVPAGLAADNGNIYVADYYKGIVFQITEDDIVLDSVRAVISQLQQPEGLQISPDGKLIVVETGADRILLVDPINGNMKILIDSIPLGVSGPPNMPPTWKLSDVDFDEKGNLYVPSDVENVIYKYVGLF